MSNSLIIENYKGGKSFVVRGNTILHKEQLKQMRGVWNSRLEGGAGWIFSNRHLEKINNYIKKNTNVVKKQSKLPEKQSKLPKKQSKLPKKQSDVPEKQSKLPKKQSEVPEVPEKQSEVHEKQSDVHAKQSEVHEKQSDLHDNQSEKSFLDTSIPFVIYGGKTVLYTDIDGNITTVLIIRVYNNIYALILLPDGNRHMTTKNRLSDLHNVSLLRKRKRSIDYMNSNKKQVTDVYVKKEENLVEKINKYSVSTVIVMFIIFIIFFTVLSILFLYTYDLISTNCSCTFNKSVLERFKYFFNKSNVQKIKTINY